jgi:hypothetical protein
MKRAVTWGLGLYVLCAVVGRLVEGMGVVRCHCAEDCWCRRPGLGAFRWVVPLGHRPAARVVVAMPAADPVPPAAAPAADPVSPAVAAPAAEPVPPAAAQTAPRYWLYKNKNDGGVDPFASPGEIEWGGHYSTRSAEVASTLNDDVAVGDVVVAYQTDLKAVIGYLRLSRIEGARDEKKLFVQPIHRLDPPFLIHQHKAGTSLVGSRAVGGMVMLRELTAEEMRDLVRLSGAPESVLRAEQQREA